MIRPLLFALLASATSALADKPISFGELPPGETIQITFNSSGCFHRDTYEFTFQQGKNLTATVAHLDTMQGNQKDAKPTPLGTVTLSDSEIAGLDRLLKFYRTEKTSGCTTVDNITVVQKNGEAVKAAESYVDGSCGSDDKKGITTLSAIASKLERDSK